MRVDSAQVLVKGDLKVRTGGHSLLASLKEGESVKAEVLSSIKGAVMMKMEDGQTFKARLDPDVALSPGDRVLLELTGKESGIASLSVRVEEKAAGETVHGAAGETASGTAGQTRLVRGFEDKTLLPYASKLAEMNISVTEETARLMRELMARHPGMTPEEAAFLAANKLAGDESLLSAALALLSGGEKTDEMIARILAMLLQPESAEIPEHGIRNPDFADIVVQPDQNPDPAANTPHSTLHTPNSVSASPLTDWLMLFGGSAEDVAKAVMMSEQAPAATIDASIPQNNSIMQSTNVENYEETLHNMFKTLENPDLSLKNPASLPPETVLPEPISPESPAQPPAPGATPIRGSEAAPLTEPPLPETLPPAAPPPETPRSALRTPQFNESAGRMIAEILSGIPEFRDTPTPALERFSNMLLKVASDSAGPLGGEIEKLTDLLDKLFTRIEKNDRDSGLRLKNAREEIFARLTFIEEAISRAAPPAREGMLEDTRRLMNHVRLLNNIDQFIYVQLPVRMSDERKTAELYLFRKKGSKRVDPENVNILLSLDLENMGHWEALINFRKKDVSVRMEVRGAKEKEHFSENTVLLHEMLAEAGFKLVNAEIAYTEKQTTPLTALSSLDRYTGGRSGRIDFMI